MASSKNGFFSRKLLRNFSVFFWLLFKTYVLLVIGLFRSQELRALFASDLSRTFYLFFFVMFVSHIFCFVSFISAGKSCEGGVWCKSGFVFFSVDQLSFFCFLPTKSRIAAKISMILFAFLFCFALLCIHLLGLVEFVFECFVFNNSIGVRLLFLNNTLL